MTNHIEEIKKKNVAQFNDEETFYPKESPSTPSIHICLMARGNHEVSSLYSDSYDDSDESNYVMSQRLYKI